MKDIRHSRRERRTARNMAYRKTLNGLWQKLPIFLIAAIAGISLSILDRSKASYQTARNSPIEVNDKFIGSVRSVKQGVWTDLLNNPYHFKYHKFANPGELLDALASRVIATNTARQTGVDAAHRQVLEKLESEKATSEEKLSNLDKQTLATSSAKRKIGRLNQLKDREEVEALIRGIIGKVETENQKHQADTGKIYEDSRLTVDSIYNDLAPKLPDIIVGVQDKPQGLFDILLKPILNDQSSLYVIFQILRITALVLLVLSFVFVLAMALRQLPLANGSDTLSEHLRGLISLKGGGGQETARAVVLSVAALGAGTAAVVAGNSINTKADRALEIASASTTAPISNNPFLRDAYYSRKDSYYRPSPAGSSTTNNATNNSTTIENNETPPVFRTTNHITVPEPVVRIVQVSDRAGTQAIVNQLTAIGSRLPLTEVTALKDSVSKVRDEISLIKTELGGFKNEASSANTTLGSIDKSLTQLSTDKAKSATAQQLLVTDTNKKLDLISTNIANFVQSPRSVGRNLTTRAGQFFGSESFALSDQSYQSIKSHLPKTSDYDAILAGLESMKYKLPEGKGTFLQQLRSETAAAAGNNKADALKKLKSWEDTILSYARLPR